MIKLKKNLEYQKKNLINLELIQKNYKKNNKKMKLQFLN